jgi:HlyD family secretion protein
VRDVSAQGTVVAAVSPTLFAVAPGNISYVVRAGDTVKTGQVLATLASPSLESEYQRENATLESLDTALQRQASRSAARSWPPRKRPTSPTCRSAPRSASFSGRKWAFDKGAIPERDLKAA